MRKINQAGLNLIKSFEGLKLKPYLCSAGVPTIGYGSTFYEDNKKVSLQDKEITEQRAEQLLANTLAKFEKEVAALLKVEVSDNEFAAIVSFAYNVGTGNLKTSTLLKLLNNNDKSGASQEFLKWNKAGGKVLSGLTRRRQAEQSLFLHKEEQSESKLDALMPSDKDIEIKLEDIENSIFKK